MAVIVKHDCATCVLVAPLVAHLAQAGDIQAVFSQDDPGFPTDIPAAIGGVLDDTALGVSWRLDLDTVPTLVRFQDGVEVARTVGWSKQRWGQFFGDDVLGASPGVGALPEQRPGCGSKTQDIGMPERLAARFDGEVLRSRRIEVASSEDEWEQMYARGWSDGLPVVPPTAERVMRMLGGTTRHPHEIVTVVPPDLVECTVEKVAINAVMAGCLPEYLPVILTALEAACTPEFNAHGLLCTTYPAGPVLMVNGPIAKAIVTISLTGNPVSQLCGRSHQSTRAVMDKKTPLPRSCRRSARSCR